MVTHRDVTREETVTQVEIGNKCCVECGSGEREAEMLLCDECDRGFHTECVGLRHVPNLEVWFCGGCVDLMDEDVQDHQYEEMRLAGWEGTPEDRERRSTEVVDVPELAFPPGYFSISDPTFDAIALSLTTEDL